MEDCKRGHRLHSGDWPRRQLLHSICHLSFYSAERRKTLTGHGLEVFSGFCQQFGPCCNTPYQHWLRLASHNATFGREES